MIKLKNRRNQQHADTEGSWAISYGDMITLLLSFFVIFFSFDFNKEKEVKLEESAIHNISQLQNAGDKALTLTQNESEQIDELNQISTVVKKANNGNLIVFFKGANFFDSGKESLNEFGFDLLNSFTQKVLPYAGKYKIKIQAFTDDLPVRAELHKRFNDNLELSALRSISVLRQLQKSGFPLNRIELGGQGVISNKLLSYLGIDNMPVEEIRKISRTVAFVLYREDTP